MREKLNSEVVINYAKLGYKPKEISDITAYKEASIRTLLYKKGFRFPEQAKTGGPVEDKKYEIISMFLKGFSPKQISEELSLNKVSVASFLNRNNYYYNPKIGNPDYFTNIDNSKKAYFLGFICADGSIVQNNSGTKVLTITIDNKDVHLLEKFKKELNSTHAIQQIQRVSNYNPDKMINHVRLVFANKTIIKDLENLGIVPRKTFILDDVINRIPEEFRDAFIIGYLDGDGCIVSPKTHKNTKTGINHHNNQSRVISFKGTEILLQSFVNHLKLQKYSLVQNSGQNIFTLTFSSQEEVLKIVKCYSNTEFFLNRKYEKLLTSNLYQAQTISSSQ